MTVLPHDVTHIDYKDTEVLKKFLTPHGQIVNRRKSGLTAYQQRLVAQAIKRARFMGLLPYVQK
jgi:small subunit ribosomal protein S18